MFSNFELQTRPKILFGKEQIKNLSNELENYQNILLVYGKSSIKENGLYNIIIDQLKNKNIFELEGITPNPRLSSVQKGIQICKEHKIDFILAVGGGSVIDAAKAISIGAKSKSDIWDIITKKAEVNDKIDLGTVITMVATGSETNDIFVVYNDETNLKRSLKTKYAYPKIAIMDPTYTLTVCKRQTINGIVDVLSHLFEQYMNKEDDYIINEQIALYFKQMLKIGEELVNNLEDYNLRANHMYIAMMGYNGDYRTILTGDWACHGLDYGLASEFDNYHGEGLAIIMPNWLKYVYNKYPNKNKIIKQFIKDIYNTDDTLKGIKKLEDYFVKIGAPKYYYQILDQNKLIEDNTLNTMVQKAQFTKPLGQTIPLTEEDIKNIYIMGVKSEKDI